MSNSRVDFGWWFLSSLSDSVEVVANDVPTEAPGFFEVAPVLVMYFCENVVVVSAMAIAATARSTAPAMAPRRSLRTNSLLVAGVLACALGPTGARTLCE